MSTTATETRTAQVWTDAMADLPNGEYEKRKEIVEYRGRMFRAYYQSDETGYSPIDDDGLLVEKELCRWATASEKRPGEVVLATDRNHGYLFDIAEAQRIIRKKGGCTKQQAAEQAQNLVQRYRDWAGDERGYREAEYIGLVVELLPVIPPDYCVDPEDEDETEDYYRNVQETTSESLWGIWMSYRTRDEDREYCAEILQELADQALENEPDAIEAERRTMAQREKALALSAEATR